MLAILKSLTLLVARIANSTLLVQCDNKTVVAFLRNEGGTRSPTLLKFTKQIYQILYSHKIYLRIHRIPGKYKSHADHLSRHRTPPEWHLVPQCTNKKKKKIKIFVKFGVPVISLFSSMCAKVVANYVSLDLKDPQALYHDTFSRNWHFSLARVFPPPFLIPKVTPELGSRNVSLDSTKMGESILEAEFEGPSCSTSSYNKKSYTYAPSMRKTYECAWNRWNNWNKPRGLNPLHPTGEVLARFLVDPHVVEDEANVFQSCRHTALLLILYSGRRIHDLTLLAADSKRMHQGIKASPGSLRSAVASKSSSKNCPLDEILSKENWRSLNTFARFYCKEVVPLDKNLTIFKETKINRLFHSFSIRLMYLLCNPKL
ncbi:unnamed protein product [Leptosia nina]|uniref:Tyr recombinase domain-containing protein n=1 Tax=Leptosia nina TaxID=320188 RepID=A0AAV1J5V4_9NEOP